MRNLTKFERFTAGIKIRDVNSLANGKIYRLENASREDDEQLEIEIVEVINRNNSGYILKNNLGYVFERSYHLLSSYHIEEIN